MRGIKLVRRRSWMALVGAVGLMAGSLAGNGVFAADAPATQPSVSDLMQKINDLQSQVQEMKQQQEHQQVQEQKLSQKEVDDTVDRVLRDADARSKLLSDEGFTAGFDHNRFFIGSADGNYLLRPWIHLQIRDGTDFRSHQHANGGDDTQNGFELRRARWALTGISSRKISPT